MTGAGLPLRRARAVFAVVVVVQLTFFAYAAWVYWPGGAEGTGRTIVVQQGDAVAQRQVEGTILVRLQPPDPDAVWRAVGQDGTTVTLVGPQPQWDTRQVENGPYTLVATIDGRVVATRELEVQNPRSDAATATAVVATTTAVATAGSALGSSVSSRISVAAIQVGKETALALGEDHLKLRTAARRRHMPSAWALMITLVMVFLFFALEGLDRLAWRGYLEALPVAGGVSAAFVALALGAESLLALAGRAASKVRFLGSGAVSLVISSLAFRTPFGFPGYVAEDDDADADGDADQPPHVEAARAAASLLVLVGLLLPFLWIAGRLHGGIAEQAKQIAIVTFATGALPLKPLPGHDIWRWRRFPATVLALLAYAVYFGFQLALLPPWTLFVLGWAGLVLYLVTFAWLRGRTATPPAPLYLAAVAGLQHARAAGALLSPRSWVRTARGIDRTGQHVARRVDALVATVASALEWALAPLARWIAAREQARIEAQVDMARGRFIRDARAFLRGLESVPDDTQVRTPQALVRLGDVRRDLARELAAHASRAGTADRGRRARERRAPGP